METIGSLGMSSTGSYRWVVGFSRFGVFVCHREDTICSDGGTQANTRGEHGLKVAHGRWVDSKSWTIADSLQVSANGRCDGGAHAIAC